MHADAGRRGRGAYAGAGTRVRTPGKAGYGLYRVRGVRKNGTLPWTEYLFELEAIEAAALTAIENGMPAKPQDLMLYHPSPKQARGDRPVEIVPTRWTSAYRGRRNLGGRIGGQRATGLVVDEPSGPVALKPDYVRELDALSALLDADLVEMVHVEGCSCSVADRRFTAACVSETMTPRQRQRAGNAAFQAEHLRRREHGLAARYAAKRARKIIDPSPENHVDHL